MRKQKKVDHTLPHRTQTPHTLTHPAQIFFIPRSAKLQDSSLDLMAKIPKSVHLEVHTCTSGPINKYMIVCHTT